MRTPLLCLAALLPLSTFAAEAAGPQVTLPLDAYEQFRKDHEKPSLTVVDLAVLTGSFAKKDLAIAFAGRASGTLPTAAVLSGDARLYGCEGDAILSRAEEGGYALTPLAARFTVRCRLAAENSDRLELSAARAVLEVQSSVADGDFTISEAGEGARDFTIVRAVKGPAEVVAPAATAHYKVTLLPDETRFRYELTVRNPNRAHQPFSVAPAAGEHVQSVDSRASYDVVGGAYRFDLPPGETSVVLEGTLPGPRFAPPVDAGLAYLLVETHPLLKAEIATAAKRVSPQEAGMAAAWRGAQAFLVGKGEEATWQAKQLETLHGTTFSIRDAAHVLYVSADGRAVGESTLAVDNAGASGIELPMKAEPTWLALGGEPQLLTRDAAGKLFLPLAPGGQQIALQDRQALKERLGFAAGSLELPQLAAPATRTRLELRYPSDWVPLYESWAQQTRTALPGYDELVLLLALFAMTERALAALRLSRRRRFALAAAAAVASLVSGPAGVLTVVLDLAVYALWIAAKVRGLNLSGFKLAGLIGGAGFAVVLAMLVISAARPMLSASVNALAGEGEADRFAYAPSSPGVARSVVAGALGATSLEEKAERKPDQAATGAAGGAYEGLPAHVEIPYGARTTRFSREMLLGDSPARVSVLLVSARLVAAFEALLALGALLLAFALRRPLAAGARELVAGLRPAPAPAPGAAS